MIGSKGSQLSGGQKQRISIARTLLSKPEYILLDEATSALDAKTEAHVLDGIMRYLEGKTMIMITHRLSSLKNFDNIFVFDKGRLIESGTYSELMKKKGLFHNLETATNK